MRNFDSAIQAWAKRHDTPLQWETPFVYIIVVHDKTLVPKLHSLCALWHRTANSLDETIFSIDMVPVDAKGDDGPRFEPIEWHDEIPDTPVVADDLPF